MAKSSTPIVTRWYIGKVLRELREAKGMHTRDAAKVIGQSVDTARRLETGEVGIVRGTLILLLDTYEADEQTRAELLELQESARKRGWWVPYGPVPDASLALLLGVETAATKLQWYSHFSIPGFIQTVDYALALFSKTAPDSDPEQMQRAAKLRPVRYEKLFVEEPVEDATIVIDEPALRRVVGDAAITRTQLHRLLDTPCTLQVIPLEAGPHPGTASFGIFRFDTEKIGPVVYLEGVRGGQVILDEEEDVAVFQDDFRRIQEAAMDPDESRDFIAEIARRVRKR